MSFAIYRTAKLKSLGEIGGSLSHTYRTRPTPNADENKLHLNKHMFNTYNQCFHVLKNAIPEKRRSNAVLCIEHLITASPDWSGWGTEKEEEFFKVKTFTEKPSLEIAKAFLESGDFLWNAGIFVWNVKSIHKAFQEFLPEMTHEFDTCEYNNDKESVCIETIYPKVEKISIDNGILEKAKNVYVIPADLGWSDLGTWTSVYENAEKDENNNAVKSKHVLTYNSKGNIIRLRNNNKAAIIDGLENYIVVDTEKALLICPISNDQLIKDYVLDLKNFKKGEKFM